jgi:hypothetical protein
VDSSLPPVLGMFADDHETLTRFTSGLLLDNTVMASHSAPYDSMSVVSGLVLIHEINMRRTFSDGVELESVHRFSIPSPTSAEYSEMSISIRVAFDRHRCHTHMTIEAFLEEAIGGLDAGHHLLRQESMDDPDAMHCSEERRRWLADLSPGSEALAVLFPRPSL